MASGPSASIHCRSSEGMSAVAGSCSKWSPRSREMLEEMFATARLTIDSTGVESGLVGKLVAISMSPPPSAPPAVESSAPHLLEYVGLTQVGGVAHLGIEARARWVEIEPPHVDPRWHAADPADVAVAPHVHPNA